MNKVEEWLTEYSEAKRGLLRNRIQKFLKFSGKTGEQLSKQGKKEAKHLILQFKADQQSKGTAINSILAYISAARNFFEYNDVVINFKKGQLPKIQKAKGYHAFSNGDLANLISIANPRYKALFSTLASTGWSLDDILDLDKQRVQALVNEALTSGGGYAFFKETRNKTGVEGLGILNPLSCEYLEKWLKVNKGKKLFGIGPMSAVKMLKSLARRSGIETKGKMRIHNIRKWTMSSLSKAGFNSFEVKRIVMKSIGISDETYLEKIDQDIEEKYPSVYENYLSLMRTTKIVKARDEDVKQLQAKIEALEYKMRMWIEGSKTDEHLSQQLGYMNQKIGNLEATSVDQQRRILQLEKTNKRLKSELQRKRESDVTVVIPKEEEAKMGEG